MQIGFIGLGKMGSRMALKLLVGGHDVVVWNRSNDAALELKAKNEKLKTSGSIEELVGNLASPKVVWMMLPAGDATRDALDEVMKWVDTGDIVIDGGNAFFEDTQRRSIELRAKGIGYLGIGVSGGVKAAVTGYPMMIGGDKDAFETIKPILETLKQPHGGYEYFGEGGAGHFVKMVHNGIEYGMMQAIGEGFGVLEKSPYSLDLVAVSKLWQKNTIVTSFLMECAKDALEKSPDISDIEGVIDANGEAEWTVNQGKKVGVPVENIDQSLDFRRRSQSDPTVSSSFAARMVAALRREFGGHNVKKK